MSSILLTEDCWFTCSCSMPAPMPKKLTIIEPNTAFFDNGKRILTDKCRLVGNFGLCRNLPDPAKNSPTGGQCTFCSQKWKGHYENIGINKMSVLTNESKMECPIGGSITPVMFNPRKTSVGNLIADSVVAFEKNSAENSAENQTAGIVKGNNVEADNNGSDTAGKSQQNENEDKKSENSSETYEYALCDYMNCPEKNTCEYLMASHEASSINNCSKTLRENYNRQYPTEAREFAVKTEENNLRSSEGKWGDAAHHIISGNQIFGKHPYLVKLANYYGYDINTAENCILLPSTHDFEGRTGIDKQANGYVAMDLMKMQWHVGHHDYSLDEDTVAIIHQYLKKIEHCHVMYYKNYVEAVEHEINILESKYMKPSCRKNDYQNKKIRFIQNINSVSKRIVGRIRAFETSYKYSYPFYVSKEACMFAFNVPNKKKFVIVYKQEKYKKTSYIALKLTVTRYKKDDYEILFSADEPFTVSDARSFIKFADNVKYFIILSSEYTLPWKEDMSREYVMYDTLTDKEISEYCKKNKQKIISFIEARDGGELYYESATKIVRQRIADMEGNSG
ncbi:MAG: AHH domain-containing protein [Ruminococcus sp.]|nr:AHH domain-containing protein [Ruminococcus sp.]